ncbi:hypothetical protein FACS1894201_05320 [Bacteroidia bacterium]|nr:hypothetical protein FACS1894201_05320 [Bacteroidia bacterium]
MIAIDNLLISDDVLTSHFCCDIAHCKGVCCIDGDAGAPLEEDEIDIMEALMDKVKPYMTEAGRKVVDTLGVFEVAIDGALTTPLVDRAECVYVAWDANGIACCAIEKAYLDGIIPFRKPISCHLYPIRLNVVGDHIALNYDRWSICDNARKTGNKQDIKVYQFLKEPLIRRFGTDTYQQLCYAAQHLVEQQEA